jgi:hypothetical protein
MPTFGSSLFLGIDGNDGGDTTVARADTGEILIRAGGGKGGLVGTGNRSESEKITVSALILANYVEFRDGFAYIIGTGFQLYRILNLTNQLNISGIAVLECGGVPTGEYGFTVAALDPMGTENSSVKLVFEVQQTGDILRGMYSFSIQVKVCEFGKWTIAVHHGKRQLARLPIVIQQGPPGS